MSDITQRLNDVGERAAAERVRLLEQENATLRLQLSEAKRRLTQVIGAHSDDWRYWDNAVRATLRRLP